MERITNNFRKKCFLGATYVCTSCHRLLYRKSVQYLLNINWNEKTDTEQSALLMDLILKYSLGNLSKKENLTKVFDKKCCYPSMEGKLWVCITCLRAIKIGAVPVQCKANGLYLDNTPEVLSTLSDLEVHLIGKRIPFMTAKY